MSGEIGDDGGGGVVDEDDGEEGGEMLSSLLLWLPREAAAAGGEDAMVRVVVGCVDGSISNAGAKIKIEWTLPFNNGAPITAFEVLI